MDLTPATPGTAKRRSRVVYVILVVVLLALGVVVYQALSSASLYFYNADEAVEQRAELGEDRFRLQGIVLGDYDASSQPFEFDVRFNDVTVTVQHDGDPPELFEPGIPVVLEGRWSPTGDVYESDRILVKHSADYEADNSDRLEDARDGSDDGEAPAEP